LDFVFIIISKEFEDRRFTNPRDFLRNAHRVSVADFNEPTIWIADADDVAGTWIVGAHGYGKRFIVRADEY
jgi:hypothetical protein